MATLATAFSGISAVVDFGTPSVAAKSKHNKPPMTRDQLLADIRLYLDGTIEILRDVRPVVETFGNTGYLTRFVEYEDDCDRILRMYDTYLTEHHSKKYFTWKDELRQKLNKLRTEAMSLKEKSHNTSQRIKSEFHRSQAQMMHFEQSTTMAAVTGSPSLTSRSSRTPNNSGRPSGKSYNLLTGPPIHLLEMKTIADLQQGISDLCTQAQLTQDFSDKAIEQTLVEEFMEYLQTELDSTMQLKPDNHHHAVFGTTGMYYERCLWTLRKLSVTYKVIPSSLQDGRHAVAGGGFADIYHGRVGEQRVCLKVLRLEFCNEALIWRQLEHPNILPLLGVNADLFSPSFCLISPWMENKDVMTYLRKNPTHNRHTVLSEVAAGLSYLHMRDPPILHGDIRRCTSYANILISDNFHCCLADFGLTLVISDSRTLSNATSWMTKGTTRWMAPELIIRKTSAKLTTNKTSRDVYAFGRTILEILTLQLPFHDKTTDPARIYSLMHGERPARPKDVRWYPDMIWNLTTRCWAEEAAARPTAQEISDFLQATLLSISYP
ncbi:kinase-like protein [Gymnopus androsaceus JB14]|uniref:Kinase-like protein n=1 Tax=Gymnopus androsaceus JB14 TaxID=1447944 RepID=A0A6A4HGJ9_9AGAR|nr:kinase-like protein [Gymnopus androsaceus JB14]